ncbi:MAG: hypothetical protein NUV86_02165 [Candidatus Scalindua sp.]|nr:hypothetical protein [Candidatus Scalindua sp.]MCR4344704.1 hypothetical protein [Candidatus Scalindua sp.]
MPITRELENSEKFESAGFNHEQAKTLADVIEKSHVDRQETLKEFIHNENTKLELNIKATISKELKDLLIKIFGIIVGTIGIAVTILKLFP